MKIELTKEQADILMNLLLHEMLYCGRQNANIYELLKGKNVIKYILL